MSTSTMVSGSVQGNALVLTLQVEQVRDPEVSMNLREQIDVLVDRAGMKNIVIDFSRVKFMGSIGFLALMRLRRHASAPRIVLCGLNAVVADAFTACKLIPDDHHEESMFETSDTIQQALSRLA